MIIYQILNKINGKKYIGQTTSKLSYRWARHQKENSNCTAICAAIQKYGVENFEVKVLDNCDSIEELNKKEEFYIKYLSTMSPSGYNLLSGGKNRRHSNETKEKISIANRGKNSPSYGKERTAEVKLAISKKALKRGRNGTSAAVASKSKKIVCLETGIIYNSVSEASRFLSNVGTSNICKVLKGKIKHIKGYSFEYLDK